MFQSLSQGLDRSGNFLIIVLSFHASFFVQHLFPDLTAFFLGSVIGLIILVIVKARFSHGVQNLWLVFEVKSL